MTEFNVAKLIDIANGAIGKLQADLDDHTKRVDAYKRKHAADWERDKLPELRKVRNNLTVALNKGGVIKLRHSLKTDALLYQEPSSSGYAVEREVGNPVNGSRRGVQERIDNLKAFVNLLQAQNGETISANQLRLIGVTKVGDILRTASDVKGPA